MPRVSKGPRDYASKKGWYGTFDGELLTRQERSSGWGWLRSSSILNEFVLEVAGYTLR